MVEGELNRGQDSSRNLGNGLRLWFQATASGWILRVEPAIGLVAEHDYAELATPPYRSVTPLSLSTDFAFRAQDAVGWNPRRFRFATSPAAYARLEEVYSRLIAAGATPPAPLQLQLSDEIAQTTEAKLTLLDSRLVPGVANQSRAATAVSSRFTSTAHTLVLPAAGQDTALGTLLWLRFRVEFEVPPAFSLDPAIKRVPQICGNL